MKKSMKKFVRDVLRDWYGKDAAGIESKAVIITPSFQDFKALSESTKPTEFGNYTLNPETQDLDFERSKVFIPDLSSFNGKPLHEVMKHVNDTYGATRHLPGIEYWKWLYENPGKNPPGANLKDGKYYFFPGSVLRDRCGLWGVPYASWDGSSWRRLADWLTLDWRSRYRVVLLEKL